MSNHNSTPSKIKAKLGLHGVLDSEVVKALKSISDGSISKEDFTKAVALAKYRALEEGQNIEAGLVSTGAGLIHGGKPYQIDEIGKSVESVSFDKLKSVC